MDKVEKYIAVMFIFLSILGSAYVSWRHGSMFRILTWNVGMVVSFLGMISIIRNGGAIPDK